jgi:hypothetical protein
MLETFYDNHPSLLHRIRVIAHALSYFNSYLNPLLYKLVNKKKNFFSKENMRLFFLLLELH